MTLKMFEITIIIKTSNLSVQAFPIKCFHPDIIGNSPEGSFNLIISVKRITITSFIVVDSISFFLGRMKSQKTFKYICLNTVIIILQLLSHLLCDYVKISGNSSSSLVRQKSAESQREDMHDFLFSLTSVRQ